MQEKEKHTLKELSYALSQMGSGLDAVDRTGSWSHFTEYKKKSQSLIDSLPHKMQNQLSSNTPNLNNWWQLQKEVQKMLEQ